MAIDWTSPKTLLQGLWAGLTDLSIYGDLVPNADTHQQLMTDINSTSEVAEHRLLAVAHTQFAYDVKQDIDVWLEQIELKRLSAEYGSDYWWRVQMLAFQYGYTLQRVGTTYAYSEVNEEAMVIRRVSPRRAKGQLLLLVAMENTGESAKLSTDQINAAQSYANRIAPAGIIPKVVSRDPDLLKVNALTVVYDPNVLTSGGESIEEPGTYPVEEAITRYPNELPFEGEFILDDLEQRIRQIPGVEKIGNLDVSAKASDESVYSTIEVDYYTDAGYMIHDPSVELSTQITYVPAI